MFEFVLFPVSCVEGLMQLIAVSNRPQSFVMWDINSFCISSLTIPLCSIMETVELSLSVSI